MISVLFLSEERASLAYYFALSSPVDLGAPGAYDLGVARDEAFTRIRGDLGGPPVPYTRGWERRELAPLIDVPVLVDRPPGSAARGVLTLEGRLERDDRLPQFRRVIETLLKRDLLRPPGPSVHTDHVWVLREGRRPWHLDADSSWCLLLLVLTALNAWWVGQRLWAEHRDGSTG